MEWENKLYQLLLAKDEAAAVVEDWAERGVESDLRLRKAKTKGHIVIETRDVIFASRIRQWHPSCKVNIKEQQRDDLLHLWHEVHRVRVQSLPGEGRGALLPPVQLRGGGARTLQKAFGEPKTRRT